jgi:hypothetical protein
MDDAERSLTNAMKEIYRRAKTEVGYNSRAMLGTCGWRRRGHTLPIT